RRHGGEQSHAVRDAFEAERHGRRRGLRLPEDIAGSPSRRPLTGGAGAPQSSLARRGTLGGRAAVAHRAGAPLQVRTVRLEGPKEGEVLVEIKATGVCHTDEFTRSGLDPEGLFPAILGHEGAGVVVDVGRGVSSVRKGDHVIPLYTP